MHVSVRADTVEHPQSCQARKFLVIQADAKQSRRVFQRISRIRFGTRGADGTGIQSVKPTLDALYGLVESTRRGRSFGIAFCAPVRGAGDMDWGAAGRVVVSTGRVAGIVLITFCTTPRVAPPASALTVEFASTVAASASSSSSLTRRAAAASSFGRGAS